MRRPRQNLYRPERRDPHLHRLTRRPRFQQLQGKPDRGRYRSPRHGSTQT